MPPLDRFEEVKLRVKEAIDLVSLVEEYLPLQRRGRNMLALCPFHQEKTPSFTVFPDTQHFKCFGCQKAGDVFTFVMEREGWTFREAFESLAERAGISLGEGVFGSRSSSKPRADVFAALSQVRDWFRHHLTTPAGESAHRYLRDRGLEAAVESFGVGFHPAAPSLGRFAAERKLPSQVLQQCGLLASHGREPFAGRLMFPIEDERGRVVGFGGRALGDDPSQPKYINSPESPFFNKRRLLFGLRRVKQSGVRRIVVMEGYTDVIACHLAGFGGAVATLGTALTSDHARLLERYATEGAVLLFDGDVAGRRAAEKAYGELQNTRLEFQIALAEEGVDPADMVAERPDRPSAEVEDGRDKLRALLDSEEDATSVFFRLLRQRLGMDRAVQVEQAAAECGRILQGVDSDLRRQALLEDMARHLGVSVQALARMVGRRRSRGLEDRTASAGAPEASTPEHSAALLAELDLVACLLADPALGEEFAGVPPGEAESASLYGMMQEGIQQGHRTREALSRFLFARCAEEPPLRDLLARCAERAASIRDPLAFLETLESGRRVYRSRQEARGTRQRLQEALAQGDRLLADRLTRLYVEQLRKT